MLPLMSEITRILEAIDQGDRHAADELLPLVYDELRKLAAVKLAKEKPGQTIDATALVHEAYIRLVGVRSVSEGFANRRHFFAAAAEAMRRILVDRARARRALKRGGNGRQVELDAEQLHARFSDAELIDTDDLLSELARIDADAAEVVRLHVFGGFSLDEAGTVLGVSRATVYRDWAFARAWLRDALSSSQPRDDQQSGGSE
jgi:RNA polymerase sigma factor (TIGR02999 family)